MAADRRVERLGLSIAATALIALTGAVLPGASDRPDLVETGVAASKRTVGAGGSLRVTDLVRNRGNVAAPRSITGYYLSRDRALDAGDTRVGGRSLAGLRPGAGLGSSTWVRIPASAALGKYRLLGCADDRRRIPESNERNNCRAAATTVTVTRPAGGDRTRPRFTGLDSATTCIPGPVDEERSASYRLRWRPASDNVTPPSRIVYDVYQATRPGGQNFSRATYTTAAGASGFSTPLLSGGTTYHFVVRARDRARNRDANRIERIGENLCL